MEAIMHTVNLFAAKTHLSRIVDDLLTGKEDRVLISRRGKPAVCVTPLQSERVGRRIGLARGKFKVPDNINGANAAIAGLFQGGKT
jgi:antitoxin (DNA-binding transcriptional repressor) of toxin-antitoxin stability system